jgi:hypothetical protein
MPSTREHHGYADWGAMFAGAVVAAGISIVLLTFGSAIGFSLTSPFEDKSGSKAVILIALGFWVLVVVVFSSMGGGYVGGRLRRRIPDASAHEVEVRDGLHGLAIWGLGIIFAAMLGAASVSGLIKGGVSSANPRLDPVAYTVDRLFRTEDGRTVDPVVLNTVYRLLVQGTVRGELSTEDRAYLAHLIAVRTSLSEAGARDRVDDVLSTAQQTADQVRRGAIITAFLIAAALAAGAAASAFGSVRGGKHRDEGTFFKGLSGWR